MVCVVWCYAANPEKEETLYLYSRHHFENWLYFQASRSFTLWHCSVSGSLLPVCLSYKRVTPVTAPWGCYGTCSCLKILPEYVKLEISVCPGNRAVPGKEQLVNPTNPIVIICGHETVYYLPNWVKECKCTLGTTKQRYCITKVCLLTNSMSDRQTGQSLYRKARRPIWRLSCFWRFTRLFTFRFTALKCHDPSTAKSSRMEQNPESLTFVS